MKNPQQNNKQPSNARSERDKRLAQGTPARKAGQAAPAAPVATRVTAKVTGVRLIALLAALVIVLTGVTALVVLRKPASASTNTGAGGGGSSGLDAAGNLVIPVSGISSKATFYSATVDGVKLEVLAVRAPDNSIRTAFNTCQVCYDSGRGYYKQQGDVLVCQNCGNRFKISQVEVSKGGCNPVPIFDKEIEMGDSEITIPAAYLKEAKDIFENWKADA